MGLDGWLDTGLWFINEVNYVLNRSYPEISENDWRAILKEKNIPEHKYDQAKCLSIITRGYIADNINTEAQISLV